VVNKAQFGAAVLLNGQKIGEHAGCFTAGRFDVTGAMNWSGENRLVIRIGAHPGAMSAWAFWGSDGEKGPWTPGIYDHVELGFADNPVIEDVQVSPRIASGEIVVQTRLKNFGADRTVEIGQQVSTWKGKRLVGPPARQQIQLAAGEETTVTQTVAVANAVLWSPENPFLYTLTTSTGGDDRSTRFGMREFHFDPATRLPMLNGKVCYLRGASMTLHRFFGDAKCGGLPWDEAWVRKLLVDIPRRMNWNAFRICIGPAPERWLDIADEAGLLLQYEFPIWSDREPMRHNLWHEDDILEQVREFVRDNWNHPSVVIWDASNETHWDFLREKLVPAVRGLDLSGRPWENGYMQPDAPGDPYETHPYQFINHVFTNNQPAFQMTDLDRVARQKPPTDWRGQHAAIINEYDWLWLHRDGTPTHLTRKVYDNLLGPEATPQQRFELGGYLLGGLTEFWRAQRQYAGVLYLAYLDGDLPHAFTCDNFQDVTTLRLEPRFESYMREAFKPLGVYLDFWQPTLKAGATREFTVVMVNDEAKPLRGQLTLSIETKSGKVLARSQQAFTIAELGRQSGQVSLAIPKSAGDCVLKAVARAQGQSAKQATVCRRWVAVADETTRASQ
jgi:beta-galactosidase